MKRLLFLFSMLMVSMVCGLAADAQSVSMKKLTTSLLVMRNDDLRSVGHMYDVFESAGYKKVRNSDVRGDGYYVNLFAKNCQVRKKKNSGRGDETFYEAVQPSKNASIAEVLCTGDGTFVSLRLITYGKANADSWKRQLEEERFSCETKTHLGHRAWQFKKRGYPMITIWDNMDKNGAYVLIVK